MKKILLGLLSVLMLVGCSSKATSEQAVEPKLVLGMSLEDMKLKDQFEVPHAITQETKKIVFAFSKDVGHTCNDFFATKKDSYLQDNKSIFVADVSGAPSLIRSMFIMPGLKEFKHTILVIDDKDISAAYKPAQNQEKITVVYVDAMIIKDIKYLNSTLELEKELQK
ncbi:hypothetical protein KJ877_05760 [bacterium]|nr:hypothetical protein [bacterium]MBU1989689.1 hypothetical protein [bacterium]